MICPYCGDPAEWTENKAIYGKNYGHSFMCYLCKKCDAYVGCHNNSRRALGTMANKELRDWRMRTHRLIDPLWREGVMHRAKVYQMLSSFFGREFHVGESGIETCKIVIERFNEIFDIKQAITFEEAHRQQRDKIIKDLNVPGATLMPRYTKIYEETAPFADLPEKGG